MTTEEKIKEIKKTKSWYKYNTYDDIIDDGVLMNDFEFSDEDILVEKSELTEYNDVFFVPFNVMKKTLMNDILNGNKDVCCTYTDNYGTCYIGEKIDYCKMQNVENEQHYIYDWDCEENELESEYNMEICTFTDSYYIWKSEATKMYEVIWKYFRDGNRLTKKVIKEWEREWKEIKSKFSDPYGNCNPISVQDMINKADF
jgi:hypothetical protein